MTHPNIQAKLQHLPRKPGVYLLRDRQGKIVYIGKAVSLRSRVQSYFRKATLRGADPKLRGLIESVRDLEYIVVRDEAEALLTEGALIKEYRPRFNVLLKDDKRFLLIRIDPREAFPRFKTCRIKKNDGAMYFGPYISSEAARTAVSLCEKIFGLRVCTSRIPDQTDYKHCLNDVIRTCSAPCIQRISREDYAERVSDAIEFLKGQRQDLLDKIEADMTTASTICDFEKAAVLRDVLHLLRKPRRPNIRDMASLRSTEERVREGLNGLKSVLQLRADPEVIECFDISNISGTFSVASMVCAVGGVPHKNRYRLFQIRTIEGINDPGMIREAVIRRYRRLLDEGKPFPDLILVDGGITQLRAAQDALTELGIPDQPLAGLAKQFEEIHCEQRGVLSPVRLELNSPALHILQRIRDEAHRFALAYHQKLRAQRINESRLDEIQGIGDKRKKLLLRHFGSMLRLQKATIEDLKKVSGIGPAYAELVYYSLHPENL